MQVSESALEKIKEVLEDEGKKDSPLRVIALPQANGSVQYMLTMEQELQADDITKSIMLRLLQQLILSKWLELDI